MRRYLSHDHCISTDSCWSGRTAAGADRHITRYVLLGLYHERSRVQVMLLLFIVGFILACIPPVSPIGIIMMLVAVYGAVKRLEKK